MPLCICGVKVDRLQGVVQCKSCNQLLHPKCCDILDEEVVFVANAFKYKSCLAARRALPTSASLDVLLTADVAVNLDDVTDDRGLSCSSGDLGSSCSSGDLGGLQGAVETSYPLSAPASNDDLVGLNHSVSEKDASATIQIGDVSTNDSQILLCDNKNTSSNVSNCVLLQGAAESSYSLSAPIRNDDLFGLNHPVSEYDATATVHVSSNDSQILLCDDNNTSGNVSNRVLYAEIIALKSSNAELHLIINKLVNKIDLMQSGFDRLCGSMSTRVDVADPSPKRKKKHNKTLVMNNHKTKKAPAATNMNGNDAASVVSDVGISIGDVVANTNVPSYSEVLSGKSLKAVSHGPSAILEDLVGFILTIIINFNPVITIVLSYIYILTLNTIQQNI